MVMPCLVWTMVGEYYLEKNGDGDKLTTHGHDVMGVERVTTRDNNEWNNNGWQVDGWEWLNDNGEGE